LSRRNNNERLGAPHPDAPTPLTQNPTGDLFSFVNPTEFVELPSRGLSYPEGHPLCGQETVEIRHMTAKEEDILTSETLLKNGLAIDRLVQSVIMDKNITVDSLLVGDKNAILVATRITGFGPLYEVGITCPACSAKTTQEYDLSELAHTSADDSGVELSENGYYQVTLPRTQIVVEMKILTSRDERTITKQLEMRKKKKLPENTATLLLSSIIASANGVTDRTQLMKLAELLPIQDAKHLRTVYESVKPDIDMNVDFICGECSHAGTAVMPLTADFFWPNS
jgi:hypothetical protein